MNNLPVLSAELLRVTVVLETVLGGISVVKLLPIVVVVVVAVVVVVVVVVSVVAVVVRTLSVPVKTAVLTAVVVILLEPRRTVVLELELLYQYMNF